MSFDDLINKLRNGELIIVYDDVNTEMGTLVGIAEMVTPQKINLMTKVGKGLIYVCITEEMANKLNLPLIGDMENSNKFLTVSVDGIGCTTGISAFERSDTISAFTNEHVHPDDFRRPGHIFPLVSKDKGLLQRIGITEAAVDLAKMASAVPISYIGEILNQTGEIASREEVEKIAEANGFCMINMSGILELKRNEILQSFIGLVIQGREVGRKIGFPTANLDVDLDEPLEPGVYGVTVYYNEAKYVGVMNAGIRPTFNQENHHINHEVHLLDFNRMIYGKILKVDVNFFVRKEIAFSSVDQLISQIKKDVEYVENRFGLLKNTK